MTTIHLTEHEVADNKFPLSTMLKSRVPSHENFAALAVFDIVRNAAYKTGTSIWNKGKCQWHLPALRLSVLFVYSAKQEDSFIRRNTFFKTKNHLLATRLGGRGLPEILAERKLTLTFRHRASCILGQAFHYSPENAFYIFNQQIYFIIWYLLDRASLI